MTGRPPLARQSAVERAVGLRLRQLRKSRGISTVQLATEVGITYQQIVKYEHGTNRISAGRLYYLAKALNLTPEAFFKGLDLKSTPPTRREEMQQQMLEDFLRISDQKQCQVIASLVKVLADN